MSVGIRAAAAGNNGAGGTTVVASSPTGTASGDLMLAAVTARGGTGQVITPPVDTWSSRTPGIAGNINAVAYGGNKVWVAGGNGGTITVSTDGGKTWTANVSSNPFSSAGANILDIAYGNGFWVATGTANKMAYATDPAGTWTAITSPFTASNNVQGVAYGNGAWVACAGSITQQVASATTPSGTWTVRWTGSGSQYMDKVKYGGGTWVAVGGNGATAARIVSTTDPHGTWTNRTAAGSWGEVRSVAYGGGVWTIVGYNSGVTGPTVNTSSDGTTWTNASDITAFGSALLESVAFGQDNKFKAVGAAGATVTLCTSSDGSTWTAETGHGLAGAGVYAVGAGSNLYLIVGPTAQMKSIPAVAWTLLDRQNSTTVLAQALYWRLATVEPSTYTWTLGTTDQASVIVVSLADAAAVPLPPTNFAGQANASSTSVAAPALGSWSVTDGLDVGFFGTAFGTTFTPPASYTEPTNGEAASTPADNTATATELVTQQLIAVTTVGAITAVAGGAAVNIGHHIFLPSNYGVDVLLFGSRL